MKSVSLKSIGEILGSMVLLTTLTAPAQAATQITCGYPDNNGTQLLQITHGAKSVTGQDMLKTSSIDGSAIRSTFKVLKVVPGADVYEYDIHMTERYSVGVLTDNHTDHSEPGFSDIRLELKLNPGHPENSEVHVRSRETIKDFRWEPSFLATHFNDDTTRKITCEVAQIAE